MWIIPPEPQEEKRGGEPNGDLTGKTVRIGGREWTVTTSAVWSDQYVVLTSGGAEGSGVIDAICRPAAVIRRHLQLAQDDGA